MARTVLTVRDAVPAGVHATDLQTHEEAGTADGHSMPNATGNIVLWIRNTGAGAHTTTIKTPGTVDGMTIAEQTVTLAAGKYTIAGPFPRDSFNQSTGTVDVDFDGTQSEVKVCAIRVTTEA